MKFYYRLNGMGIDNWDEKEVLKYNEELNSFEDLAQPFERLKEAFENKSKDRVDIMVCVLPGKTSHTYGVIEVTACHIIKKKLFSGEIKKQCYALSVTKEGREESTMLYFKETTNFEEVKTLFYTYIVEQMNLQLSGWDVTKISNDPCD